MRDLATAGLGTMETPKMAKDLGAKGGDNVTKLPTRAARGAGKSKPSADPKRMKPSVPEEKKTPAAAASAPVETQADRDKKLRENLMARLVGLRSNHNGIVAAEDALKAELRELTAKKKEIRAAVHACGVPLSVFDEALGDASSSRVDLKAKEKARDLVREAYGLVTLTQPDLLEGLPEAAKGGVYWEAQGYQDGIAGKFSDVPEACAPENHSDYRRGFDNAMEANAKGLKALSQPDATIPAPGDEPEDDAKAEGQTDGGGEGDDAPDDEAGGGDDEDGAVDPAPVAPPAETSPAELLH